MENRIEDKTGQQTEDKASPQEMHTAERAILTNRLRILEELSEHWEETNEFFKMIEEVSNQIRELDEKQRAA
ncbi:hypothetical protein HZA44_02905 [Candidatus Peregrinibacteria bacterium]|nr:hypothetical protein [Candidatus Peregrinibacteria bacterium]